MRLCILCIFVLKILQISKKDSGGGAANIARNLHHAYNARNHNAWIAVKEVNENYQKTLAIQQDSRLRNRFKRRLHSYLGIESYSHNVPDIHGFNPDIVNCHNLHNEYFDLSVLPGLSHRVPVILTLHDAWLLTGHCAHPMDCERWKQSCGSCPDLQRYPAIRRDATRYNWIRKKNIFKRSRLYVTTPSNWLMAQVNNSIIAPAIIESRVIPNGVDLAIFKPSNKRAAKARLNLPPHALVMLFAGENLKTNPYKDYATIEQALQFLAQYKFTKQIILIVIGCEKEGGGTTGGSLSLNANISIHQIPYQKDSHLIALYYQAADIYLHAAHADTFPNTVIEALACGTPVIATDIGGISEQVDESAGIIVPPRNPSAMAEAIRYLIDNDDIREIMGRNASFLAKQKFDLQQQVDVNLDWYKKILKVGSANEDVGAPSLSHFI